MKKSIIIIAALLLGAGFCQAQSNDSIERVRQQQQLLEQQQKEQEALQLQQQKELERLEKEQAKKQEQEMKALERQQEQAQRDQERAQAQEQKALEKKQRRAEKRESWGRKCHISLDPLVGIQSELTKNATLLSGYGWQLGADFTYHYPIAKKWDYVAGVGYHLFSNRFTNSISYNSADDVFIESYNSNYLHHYAVLTSNTLEIPLRLTHVNTDKDEEWFVGITLGYSLGNNFKYQQLQNNNDYKTTEEFSNVTPPQQVARRPHLWLQRTLAHLLSRLDFLLQSSPHLHPGGRQIPPARYHLSVLTLTHSPYFRSVSHTCRARFCLFHKQ